MVSRDTPPAPAICGSSERPILVLGGRQVEPLGIRSSMHRGYKEAVLARVDAAKGTVEVLLEYVSPPGSYDPDEPGIAFHASTIAGSCLLACTATEVLAYQLPDLTLQRHLSLPSFNDVHHVALAPSGHLLIVSSGLDMVIETDWSGQVHTQWNVRYGRDWPADRDYRTVSTKPHRSHPNYVFLLDEEPWVTRFHQRDAMSLSDQSSTITLSDDAGPHDGVKSDGRLYFTTVDGKVVVVDAALRQIARVVDLRPLSAGANGWCRGIHVEGNIAWVGFSKLRRTRFRENLSWLKHGSQLRYPTHVACYDLAREERLYECRLDRVGIDVIFDILPADW